MNLNKTFVAVQDASRNMLALSDKEINQILLAVADAAINKTDFILSENQKDLERMLLPTLNTTAMKLTKKPFAGHRYGHPQRSCPPFSFGKSP